jgi:hypothetical protein
MMTTIMCSGSEPSQINHHHHHKNIKNNNNNNNNNAWALYEKMKNMEVCGGETSYLQYTYILVVEEKFAIDACGLIIIIIIFIIIIVIIIG